MNDIYHIDPIGSPLFKVTQKDVLIRMDRKGGSMRKRRRRVMKPLQFTPKSRKIHDWTMDKLEVWR